MLSTSQVLSEVQKEFETLLSAKTSWGRNEIKALFEKAKAQALMKLCRRASNEFRRQN